jgi:hypothetical protein
MLPFTIDSAQVAVDGRGDREDWERLLHDPADRDPRGFIVSAEQADMQTARKFVNALLMNGVEVHRATDSFTVEGTRYPAGSYVVKADQAFRPHVLDMFLPQQHPNDFAFPGAPPTAPYDNAGWTLAYQMGVAFDAPQQGFDGPFEQLDAFALDPEPAMVSGPSGADAFVVDHRVNDAFVLVNRALAAGHDVGWLTEPVDVDGQTWPAGAFVFEARARGLLEEAARETGVPVHGLAEAPQGETLELGEVRIGLWDQYGGSMPSGWTRFILEQFEFDYEVVYPPDLDEGDLRARFDVLIFPDGAIPDEDRGGGWGQPDEDFVATIPAEYRERLGSVSVEATVPNILEFVRDGGVAITVGSSTSLATHAGLPVSNHLVDESGTPYDRTEYFTPGSVHDIALEHRTPLTHGLDERAYVLHSHSPVFDVAPGAEGVTVLGRYDSARPLASGWAWGQEKLEGGAALLEADLGEGKMFLFGPKITFRGQSHGTFPLLFNAIYYGTAAVR